MNEYDLIDNPLEDNENNAFYKLAKVVIMAVESTRDGSPKNYRTKMASSNEATKAEALTDSYLDGFYSYFTKQASYHNEYVAISELGSMLGLEMLFDIKESLNCE